MGRREIIGQRRPTQRRAPAFRLPGRVRSVTQPRNGRIRVVGTEDVAQAACNDAARAAQRTYDEVLVPWFDEIREEWPVKTGFSKGALQLTAKPVGPYLKMRLENLAFYAGWIRQRKERTQNLVARLVWKPSQRVADEMTKRLRQWLADGG